MPELAKAYVQIIPSAEGIQNSLTNLMSSEAETAGQSSGSKFVDAFGSVAKVGLASIGALAGATIAAGGALVKGAADVAAYGDNIDKMSQKMGLSAQAYQEWDAVMRHSGTSIESMQSSMKTLANAVENGNDAFERIGLTMEDVQGMSNEDLFSATITALQGVENETERTYLAGQLLGRGATELGALLNTSAADTQAMKDRVHELGGVLSDEAVANAAAFQDSLQDMQTAFGGLKNSLMSEFMPGLTGVMDGLANIFAGDSEKGLGQITAGIQGVVGKISETLPAFMEVGSQILVSLASAITSNLPTLLSCGAEALMTIGSGLLEQLPQLLSVGLKVIVTLASGIAESLPEMIPSIVGVVLQIVETLTNPDTLTSLVDASIAIIMGLANGLIAALPQLLAQAPVIISNLVTAVISAAPQLLSAALELIVTLASGIIDNLGQIFDAAGQIISTVWDSITSLAESVWNIGKSIVEGVWQGISNAADWLWQQVTGFFSGIVDGVKSALGIASPSKVFASVGQMMAAGLGVGWDSEMDAVARDINGSLTDLAGADLAIAGSYSFTGAGGQLAGAGGAGSADVISAVFTIGNMIVDAINSKSSDISLDGVKLARQLQPYSKEETRRVGSAMVIGGLA